MYLVSLVAYKPHDVVYRRHVYHLQRGQAAIVMSDLATRAKWPKEKVRRFFRGLVKKDMITISGSFACCILTVANYEKYQVGTLLESAAVLDAALDTATDAALDTATDRATLTVMAMPDTAKDTALDASKDTQTKNVFKKVQDLKSSPLAKSLDSTNYQGFQDAWTSICVSAGLHGVRDWSTWHERVKGAWGRIAASKDPSWSALSPLERIRDLFTHAARISFLAGDNSRKWKADLEFVLRPLSIDRIMGGYYCDMVQSEPPKPIPVRTEEEDRLQRERGLAWLDPDNVKEEVKDER